MSVPSHCPDSYGPLMQFIFLFFFNDTATTEIYTLSLHDALPISALAHRVRDGRHHVDQRDLEQRRSEEHTSELQSRRDLVCRLLLEKKKRYPSAPFSRHNNKQSRDPYHHNRRH